MYITNQEKQEFEISDERLQEFNDVIEENLKHIKSKSSYSLLYELSFRMSKELKIKDRSVKSIKTSSSQEKTKEVALQFFQSIDMELFEKAKEIIEGKSEFEFNMYQFDKNDDYTKTKSNGLPVHTKTGSVMTKKGHHGVYVPCKGTIEDIYVLVHELSHTFEFVENDNPTRNLMGEITPYCFEAMLSKYLVENGIATKEDVVNRELGANVSHFDDAVETLAKIEFMRIKNINGKIKREDIIKMQKEYGITNRQLGYILGRLVESEPSADYSARYMVAGLVYPHYFNQYKQNPQNAIQTLKEHFKLVKSDKFIECLKNLGIDPSIDCISGLIQESNDRLQYLQNTRENLTKKKKKDEFDGFSFA